MKTLFIVAVVGFVLYVTVLRPSNAAQYGANPVSPPPLVPANAGDQQLSSQQTFNDVMAGINAVFNGISRYAGANPATTTTGGAGFSPPPPPSFSGGADSTGSAGGIFGTEYDYNA